MVEQELDKPERCKKLRTDTIKNSRAAVNKKLAELKVRRSNNKTRTFQFKTKSTKNTKSQINIEYRQRYFKNTVDYQHPEFAYI